MIEPLLGRPHAAFTQGRRRHLEWQIGPERDSRFQIDSEYLALRFDRRGVFDNADRYQG